MKCWCGSSQQQGVLRNFPEELEAHLGKFPLSGRYHRPPRQIADDFKVTSTVLGTGYTGEVKMATRVGVPNHKFAVKELKLASFRKGKMAQMKQEVENYLLMDHPHIVRLYDVFESKESLHLVMECMEGGELYERVRRLKKFPEQDAADAVWQILLALNYIHSHGIVHRDIKLENFLFEKEQGNNLKLIDFGFSKHVHTEGEHLHASLGTASYVAPEVLLQDYTSQCDLWSLGVISFILLSGQMPFPVNMPNQSRNILQGSYTLNKSRWKETSPEALNFVQSLLEVNPDNRLNASTALCHPWIANRHIDAEIDTGVIKALHSFGHASRFRRCAMEIVAWSLSTEECAQVNEQFISLDETHHGGISMQSLKKAMTTLGVEDEAEIRLVFDSLDLHHDREIHYSDFLAAMVATKIPLNDELITSAFKHFDEDECGYITAQSLRNVLGDTFEGAQVDSLLNEAEHMEKDRMTYAEFATFLRKGSDVGDDGSSTHLKL
jgi:calcium-dependent protein kinase